MPFLPNVLCGTSHNLFFLLRPGQMITFSMRMRVQRPGSLWRFTYTNVVDSTWDDGSLSRANTHGDGFSIVSAAFMSKKGSQDCAFAGKEGVAVAPGAVLECDPCPMPSQDGYIEFRWCLQAGDKPAKVPATPDSQAICSFAEGNAVHGPAEAFVSCLRLSEENLCPMPELFSSLFDAELPRMAYLGDSITQGVGTRIDRYESWAARISAMLSMRYAGHNCGLGFARIADAASDGPWLQRVKGADVVNVCLGVNDLLHGDPDAGRAIEGLRKIVRTLKTEGGVDKVVLFTVPPFDYEGEVIEAWRAINREIRQKGHLGADLLFDFASVLSVGGDTEYRAKYGGHPDKNGCLQAANAYMRAIVPQL